MVVFSKTDECTKKTLPPKGDCRIVQFSDIHLGLLPSRIAQVCNKRLLGVCNHQLRRRNKIHQENIHALAKLLPSLEPDVVVCTGDLTSVALPEEFELAVQKLAPIRQFAGDNFVYIPGNHDAYVNTLDARQALENTFSLLNHQQFSLKSLPIKLDFPGLRLILLNPSHPSGWFFSYGTITEEMSVGMQALLQEPKKGTTVLLSHFPALNEKGHTPGLRHGLRGAHHLINALEQGQAAALLSGHVHRPYAYAMQNGATQLCSGSLTLHGSFIIADFSNGKLSNYKIARLQ